MSEKKPEYKSCQDCANILEPKDPLPMCGASKVADVTRGRSHRTCLQERTDGIGTCGLMGNKFKAGKPELKGKAADARDAKVQDTRDNKEAKPVASKPGGKAA